MSRKHNCTGTAMDPFMVIKEQIGKKSSVTIEYGMNLFELCYIHSMLYIFYYNLVVNGIPHPPNSGKYKDVTKCVWEWDILGLVSIGRLLWKCGLLITCSDGEHYCGSCPCNPPCLYHHDCGCAETSC